MSQVFALAFMHQTQSNTVIRPSYSQARWKLETRRRNRLLLAGTLKLQVISKCLGLLHFLFYFIKHGNVGYFSKNKLKSIKIGFGADYPIQYKRLHTVSDHQKITNKITVSLRNLNIIYKLFVIYKIQLSRKIHSSRNDKERVHILYCLHSGYLTSREIFVLIMV